jgi:hypothetical protein
MPRVMDVVKNDSSVERKILIYWVSQLDCFTISERAEAGELKTLETRTVSTW